MLKKVNNKIRRSLSKGKGDQQDKEESKKKKASPKQKKTNQSSQTDLQNVNKKLDFNKLANGMYCVLT